MNENNQDPRREYLADLTTHGIPSNLFEESSFVLLRKYALRFSVSRFCSTFVYRIE